MDSNINIKSVYSGMLWQALNRIGSNGIQFLIYLILARLLQPNDFGIIAILSVFINFSSLFISSGLGTALVQSRKVSDLDYSSVLYLSITIASILYASIYFLSPFIASYYRQESITHVLRLYSISILFSAINGVQSSILFRNLEFKKISIISLLPLLISGIISVIIAFLGYGIYSLVVYSLLSGLLNVIIFGIYTKWLPKLQFSISRIKVLFSFSYKILLSNLIEEIYKNIFPLIFGRMFSAQILGFYNFGKQIPLLLTSTINATVTSVAYPLYSRKQDEKGGLKKMLRKSITTANFIIFPLMVFVATLIYQLIPIVFTEKWQPSVSYVPLFCIIYGLSHLDSYNFQAISAIGRSDVILKYQVFKKIIAIFLLIITLSQGIKIVIYGQVIFSIISLFINLKPNYKYLGYSFREQFDDIWRYLLASLLMFLALWFVSLINLNIWLIFLFKIFVGILFYCYLAYRLKLPEIKNLLFLLKNWLSIN